MSDIATTAKPFRLEFSNRVIEHLGIKLYQNKPTNVVAEFLSNCWDADATEVQIELTAHGKDGHPTIVITDNGRGMTRDELTDEFLIIGRNRRAEAYPSIIQSWRRNWTRIIPFFDYSSPVPRCVG